jgi:phosphoribosylformylglycinamidine cyclo-ligase
VIKPLLDQRLIKGMAHITGGGITENLPRILPEGTAATIDRKAWVIPPLFMLLQQRGGIATDEMFRAFNMGIGLIVACAPSDSQTVVDTLRSSGSAPIVIGRVTSGHRDVHYTT